MVIEKLKNRIVEYKKKNYPYLYFGLMKLVPDITEEEIDKILLTVNPKNTKFELALSKEEFLDYITIESNEISIGNEYIYDCINSQTSSKNKIIFVRGEEFAEAGEILHELTGDVKIHKPKAEKGKSYIVIKSTTDDFGLLFKTRYQVIFYNGD